MAEGMNHPIPIPSPILILTRPDAAAARFLAQVRAGLGRPVTAIASPLIEIGFTDVALPDTPCAGLIFTSENGARAAQRLGLDRGLPVFAVGDQTADAARRAGFLPLSADGDANALVALILSRRPRGPLWHLRGEHSRGDVAAQVTAGSIAALDLVVYRQTECRLSAPALAVLGAAAPVILPLFSPRTVSIMAKQGPFVAPLHVVAISPAVADAARTLIPATIGLAQTSTGAAMVWATIAALQGPAPLERAAPSC